MEQTLMPTIPYVQAFHQGKRQNPKAIAIRLSDTTSVSGAALGIAMTWHRSNSPVESCHYVVDEAFTYQCVPDNLIAYPSPVSSKGTISINVCAKPLDLADSHEWLFDQRRRVLERTANLVAELSLLHRIPAQYLDGVDASRWNRVNWFSRKGILIRTMGVWPFSEFLDEVNQNRS